MVEDNRMYVGAWITWFFAVYCVAGALSGVVECHGGYQLRVCAMSLTGVLLSRGGDRCGAAIFSFSAEIWETDTMFWPSARGTVGIQRHQLVASQCLVDHGEL